MKKLSAVFLAILLVMAMSGCSGRNNTAPTAPPVNTTPSTTPATSPSTEPSNVPAKPEMDPTLGTNIPDDDIGPTLPDGMDGTDSTDSTEEMPGTDSDANSAVTKP